MSDSMLTPIHVVERKRGYDHWLCICDCGTEKVVRGDHLRGDTKSCGCLRRKRGKNWGHARATHGEAGSPEYLVWRNMKARCTNPNSAGFKNWGGRGIEVCARWFDSFENFLEDMGARPANHSIDRIDNDGDYTPENCRWATLAVQLSNRRPYRKRKSV